MMATVVNGLTGAKADLIQVDQALESWRDAGYDLPAAIGELVDNSIQASAQRICIETFRVPSEHKKASIGAIAVSDNGIGIDERYLASTLTMGFSTRYGQRDGMGRFGVGSKMAALSQARRVDIYSRPIGDHRIYHTYFDLDRIKSGEQEYLEGEVIDTFPSDYGHLMLDDKGREYQSGTLVVWSKVDRLEEGGKFGTSVDERISELLKYLGRTYRKYLAGGLFIMLNGREVTLHDPLFLLKNPRFEKIREKMSNGNEGLTEDDWEARMIDTAHIDIDGHEIEITVTLLPRVLRRVRGDGGIRGSAQPFKELHVQDNEGRVSILRYNREIYYDIIPRLFPGGVAYGDRFIGVEVSFSPVLDEYFQVRHVKRGAEPVNKLRDEIKKFIEKPILAARKQIAEGWDKQSTKDRANDPTHTTAKAAFDKVNATAPRGIAGAGMSPRQANVKLETAAKDIASSRGIDDPEEVAKLKEEVRNRDLTVIDGDWPGKELFDITHVNGRVILRLNWRHPFMERIYAPLKDAADGSAHLSVEQLQQLVMRVEGAIDLLLFSYAKAENLDREPDERYGQLRTHWGMFLADGVQELLRTTVGRA